MFDLYLLHIIGNGIKYYSSSRTLFDPLFPHVSEAMRTRMWNSLQEESISLDGSFNIRTAGRLPLITVQSSEQFFDQQGLAQNGGENVNHIFTSQEAIVNIFTEAIETTRLIQTIVQASVLLFKDVLIKGHFQNVIYVGSSPLIPESALQGENLTTYGRQVRFSALHLLEIPAKIEQLDDIGAVDPQYTINVKQPTNIS